MKAIGKYILIENIVENQTAQGFNLTGTDKGNIRVKKAKVITSGTEVDSVDNDDVIYYESHRSFPVPINDKILTVIREQDVVIVVDPV